MKCNKLFLFFLILSLSGIALAEDVPPKVNELIPILASWGNNGVLVSAVQTANKLSAGLDEIKKQDKLWQQTAGVDDFMQALMQNDAAKELLRLEATQPYYTEVFVMDNQGANVAMTNKTSDYWQGDEAKFTESYKEGQGVVHIGKVKFDESAQAYLVQVSVPVMSGDNCIGAITVGINLDELEATGYN